MPTDLKRPEDFLGLLHAAKECRVVRRGEKVKLKLRTPGKLYTLVTTQAGAEQVLKRVAEAKLPLVEI